MGIWLDPTYSLDSLPDQFFFMTKNMKKVYIACIISFNKGDQKPKWQIDQKQPVTTSFGQLFINYLVFGHSWWNEAG